MYHALIENALVFLSTFKRDSNKTRDLYKRLELALRAHGPRLTAMRRTTPLEFAVWIKQVEDFAREGRTEALNSFYGHTVVREPQKPKPIRATRNQKKLQPRRVINHDQPNPVNLLLILFVGSLSSPAPRLSQKRDHLTQQEVDLVKEAQVLDKRIDVFIKAAERRMMVINGSARRTPSS